MTSTRGEALLMGAFALGCLIAAVAQWRRKGWKQAVPALVGVAFALPIALLAAHGTLFVGPGGHGGVSVP